MDSTGGPDRPMITPVSSSSSFEFPNFARAGGNSDRCFLKEPWEVGFSCEVGRSCCRTISKLFTGPA